MCRAVLLQVRDFQAIIGRETREQCLEQFGAKPDVLLACVGGGSNAIGLFHEFVDDKDVSCSPTGQSACIHCCPGGDVRACL